MPHFPKQPCLKWKVSPRKIPRFSSPITSGAGTDAYFTRVWLTYISSVDIQYIVADHFPSFQVLLQRTSDGFFQVKPARKDLWCYRCKRHTPKKTLGIQSALLPNGQFHLLY